MNRWLTVLLVVVFAALLIYVLVVQAPRDNAAKATPSAAPATYLFAVRADQINGVHVVDRVKGRPFDLVKDATGTWSLVNPGPQPAEQSLAAADVSSLMTLSVNGTITTATDLSAFGVLSPTLTVELDLADGSKLKAAIGDKSPTGSDYYALREGEKQVVLLSTAAHDTLTNLFASPPVVPPTPTATVPTPGPGTPTWTPTATETAVVTTTATLTVTATSPASTTPQATLTPTATSTEAATATSTPETLTVSPTTTATVKAAGTAVPARTSTKAPKSSATP